MSYRIVVDSCGELSEEMKTDGHFVSVPLTLEVGNETIVDDEGFDQASFLQKVAACPTCPKSACPSPAAYLDAYNCGEEHVYAVTLSAELSGSYNSAILAREMFMEEQRGKKCHVFNSRSASAGETLIALRIQQLEEQRIPFEQLVELVEEYIDTQHTYFVLDNLDTLRKNGRLSKVKAFVASALKPIMGSTPEGNIAQLDQTRGSNRALVKMTELVIAGVEPGQRRLAAISHCNCPERAEIVRAALASHLMLEDILVLPTAGVSSMYANDGGVIVVI